jgi:hypothetical protein
VAPPVGVVKGGRVTFLSLSPPAFMVRRDSTRSRSFVLAALRALHRDGAFAAGVLLRYRGKPEMR